MKSGEALLYSVLAGNLAVPSLCKTVLRFRIIFVYFFLYYCKNYISSYFYGYFQLRRLETLNVQSRWATGTSRPLGHLVIRLSINNYKRLSTGWTRLEPSASWGGTALHSICDLSLQARLSRDPAFSCLAQPQENGLRGRSCTVSRCTIFLLGYLHECVNIIFMRIPVAGRVNLGICTAFAERAVGDIGLHIPTRKLEIDWEKICFN